MSRYEEFSTFTPTSKLYLKKTRFPNIVEVMNRRCFQVALQDIFLGSTLHTNPTASWLKRERMRAPNHKRNGDTFVDCNLKN